MKIKHLHKAGAFLYTDKSLSNAPVNVILKVTGI